MSGRFAAGHVPPVEEQPDPDPSLPYLYCFGGVGLPDYRLFYLDRFSGRIKRSHEFEADHDAAAIALAEMVRGDDAVELWCRSREVQRWAAK